MARRRLFVLTLIIVLIGGIGGGLWLITRPPGLTAQQRAALAAAIARRNLVRAENQAVAASKTLLSVKIPTTAHHLVPDPTASLFSRALKAHVVFGFVPYWTLSLLDQSDYEDVSDLAYFGPILHANGSFVDTEPAWNQPIFSTFVQSAHAQGDRVFLTVSTTQKSTIDHLTKYPSATASVLAHQLVVTMSTRDLDGVDVDVEGYWQDDRKGYVEFITDLDDDLKVLAPNAELVVNTYIDSAGDPDNFFDVHALSEHADALFLMGYDMNEDSNASANAPLIAPDLGLSDVQELIAYTKDVSPTKLILGMPFYGYDFTTNSSSPGAPTTTAAPEAIVYSSIVSGGHVAYWDSATETAFATYKVGTKWHQVWFDSPVSIALKTALAAHFRLKGVGVWALGMQGDNDAMTQALDGKTAPKKGALVSP